MGFYFSTKNSFFNLKTLYGWWGAIRESGYYREWAYIIEKKIIYEKLMN
jgi:hypothetical protein